MKKKQINVFFIATALSLVAALVFYGCKKNTDEKLDYSYFQKVMAKDKNLAAMQESLHEVSKATAVEAYLKRSSMSYDRIDNSLTPYVKGHQQELARLAGAVKTEPELKEFYGKIGMRAQSGNLLQSLKKHLAQVRKFYDENPEFKELPKKDQVELLYSSMRAARMKKNNIFRPVQAAEADPCWDDWSEDMQDAEDDQFWEMAGLDVAFVLCCIGTEGIGAALCYEGYLAGAALSQLHYIDNVNKADNKYNKCVGDQTQL